MGPWSLSHGELVSLENLSLSSDSLPHQLVKRDWSQDNDGERDHHSSFLLFKPKLPVRIQCSLLIKFLVKAAKAQALTLATLVTQ